MSGAQIAEKLVLSPETVRTHVRNAMAKLGASTRSQAVALALQQRADQRRPEGASLPDPPQPARPAESDPSDPNRGARARCSPGWSRSTTSTAAPIYLAEEDGLSLRRVAAAEPNDEHPRAAGQVALGDGALGRAALERRAQLGWRPGADGSGRGALIAAPMIGRGRLLGVIALAPRVSRPIGRSELLLLQAFANRVGEILVAGGDVDQRLDRAMERFRASWSGSPRIA